MKQKTIPAITAGLLLPPVSPERYKYFENEAKHPFDVTSAEPTLLQAWWLAECSLAAYADQAMAEGMFRRGDLKLAGKAPVLGKRFGGQSYVVADDKKIIVVFRGTQVVKSEHVGSIDRLHDTVKKTLRDMLTDAKVKLVPWTGRSGGMVHQGFAESLNEMLPGINERIDALKLEKPERKLWLTGHSLGAALATLAADRIEGVQGLHTAGASATTRMRCPGCLEHGWDMSISAVAVTLTATANCVTNPARQAC
jgi:triacylglycerol lipase